MFSKNVEMFFYVCSSRILHFFVTVVSCSPSGPTGFHLLHEKLCHTWRTHHQSTFNIFGCNCSLMEVYSTGAVGD
jgi:hypothetical protein